MQIDETEKGFVIVRGKKRDVFFSFFVDADSSSWTNYSPAARLYDTREEAEKGLLELRRRDKSKRMDRRASMGLSK